MRPDAISQSLWQQLIRLLAEADIAFRSTECRAVDGSTVCGGFIFDERRLYEL